MSEFMNTANAVFCFNEAVCQNLNWSPCIFKAPIKNLQASYRYLPALHGFISYWRSDMKQKRHLQRSLKSHYKAITNHNVSPSLTAHDDKVQPLLISLKTLLL